MRFSRPTRIASGNFPAGSNGICPPPQSQISTTAVTPPSSTPIEDSATTSLPICTWRFRQAAYRITAPRLIPQPLRQESAFSYDTSNQFGHDQSLRKTGSGPRLNLDVVPNHVDGLRCHADRRCALALPGSHAAVADRDHRPGCLWLFRDHQHAFGASSQLAWQSLRRAIPPPGRSYVCAGTGVHGYRRMPCRRLSRSEEHTSELQSLRHL